MDDQSSSPDITTAWSQAVAQNAAPQQASPSDDGMQKAFAEGPAGPRISNTSSDIVNPHMANFLNGIVPGAFAGIGRHIESAFTDLTSTDYTFNSHEAVKNVPTDFSQDQREKLLYADTPGQFNALVSEYAIQNSAAQFQKNSPVQATAEQFATGFFDPVARAASLGNWARLGFSGIGGAIAQGAVGNTVVTSGEEALAHATSDRSYHDSLVNIAMAPVLGGVIGSAEHYLSGLKISQSVADEQGLETSFKTPKIEAQKNTETPTPVEGEEKSQQMTFPEPKTNEPISPIAYTFEPSTPGLIKTVRSISGEQVPLWGNSFLHLQNNESVTARTFAADHSVTGVVMKDGQVADSRTLENQRDMEIKPRLVALNDMRANTFTEYKNDIKANPVDGLNMRNLGSQFDAQVHHYISTGGEAEDGLQYHAAAKKLGDFYLKTMKPVWERYTDALQSSGKMSPEDVQFIQEHGPNYAVNYFARNYNTAKIKADGGKSFVDWLTPRVGANSARDIYNNVVGEPTKISDTKSGEYVPPNFFRKLNIPDSDLIEGGWLNSDIRGMFKNFMYKHVPDTLYLERYGDIHPQSVIDGIKGDYESRMDGASDKETKRLDQQMKSTLKSVQFVQDDFRYRTGIFANRDNANWKRTDPSSVSARAVQLVQTMFNNANLNSAVLRDASQYANAAFFNGIDRVAGTAIQKMALEISALLKNPEAMQASRAMKEDMFSTAVGLAHSVDYTNYEPVADMNLNVMSKAEKLIQNTQAWNRRANPLMDGSDIMHNMLEYNGAANFNNRALGAISQSGGDVSKISDKDLNFLHGFGIKDEYMPRIAEMFDAHGETAKGVIPRYDFHIPYFSQWTDKEAAQVYQNAMYNMSHGATITPTFQSNPFLRNTLLGQVVGSLTGFMNSVIGRTLVPAISQDKGLFATGMASMAGLYVASHMIMDYLKGESVDGWDNIRDKYAPSILKAVGMRTADTLQKGYYGTKSFQSSDMPDEGKPREADPNKIFADAVTSFGSVPGYGLELSRAAAGAVNANNRVNAGEQPSEYDLNNMSRILPFRNTIAGSFVYNEIGNAIRDHYGMDEQPVWGTNPELSERMENARMKSQ